MTSTPASAVLMERGIDAATDAAAIWARATARRDRLPTVPELKDKLSGIESALALDGALLWVARSQGEALAFALVVPRVNVLELLYLAVHPTAWGTGLGRQLLNHLRLHAEKAKSAMELWVIADNSRAISLYENAGWIPTEDLEVRNSSGRLERRYVLWC